MNSWHQELDSWDKVLDKTIKAKSKAALQSPTSIWDIDACCWKGRRPDKKKESFKPYIEKKAKPADSQLTTLAETNIQAFG